MESSKGQVDSLDIKHISLDPDGNFIVSLLKYGQIVIFDAISGKMIGSPVVVKFSDVWEWTKDIEFDPSGSQFATVFYEKGIIFWDMDLSSWADAACSLANRNLSPDEWASRLGSIPYKETCP